MSEHETRDRFGVETIGGENAMPEHTPRYSLYALCTCPTCEGRGRTSRQYVNKCPDCRGEGRIRQEVASCETAEAVGVALVTCAREGEWTDADGNPCAFGLLDREGEKGQKWLILPWSAYTPRHVSEAGRALAGSKKRTETS